MSGISSAAIIGGATLAGSIGSGLLAKGAAGGAAAGAGAGGQQAYLANQAQINRNTSNASPYTAGGVSAMDQIGALLGWGNLTTPGGEGAVYNFNGDPNAQGNAIANLRNFAGASGATLPTYNPYNFTPSHAVTDSFSSDPSYGFRFNQGVAAQDASAAAKGTLLSGAQQQALTNYGQGAASQEYANWYNRLMQQNQYNYTGEMGSRNQNFNQQQTIYGDQQGQWNNALATLTGVAGMGNSATSSLAGSNTGATGAAGNALTGSAATAANYTNQGGQDLASGIGSGVNNALQAYMLRNAFGGAGGGGGSSYVPGGGSGPSYYGPASASGFYGAR